MEQKDDKRKAASLLSVIFKNRIVQGFALGAVSALAFVFLYVYAFGGVLPGSGKTYEYYKGLDESYGKYYEMQELAEEQALFSYHFDGIDDEAFGDMIMGGLEEDKYATYYTADEYAQMRKKYYSFVGVGIAMDIQDGKMVITKVISDSAAGEAGIQVDDVIIKVNGTKAEDIEDPNTMFDGEEGEKFDVVIERDGERKTYELELRKIQEETVRCGIYDRDNHIGYISISSFAKGTSEDFKKAVEILEEKNCDKLIIDLRNNLGGREYDGLQVADQLLPKCTIITEQRRDGEEKVRKSDASCISMKYVLLVNEYTASSSEIVSSAVKANKGGTIIGTVTYGKGLIQVIHEFDDGSACKYTIGEYFAADGSKIQGIGIKPDIEAEGEDVLRQAVKALLK